MATGVSLPLRSSCTVTLTMAVALQAPWPYTSTASVRGTGHCTPNTPTTMAGTDNTSVSLTMKRHTSQ